MDHVVVGREPDGDLVRARIVAVSGILPVVLVPDETVWRLRNSDVGARALPILINPRSIGRLHSRHAGNPGPFLHGLQRPGQAGRGHTNRTQHAHEHTKPPQNHDSRSRQARNSDGHVRERNLGDWFTRILLDRSDGCILRSRSRRLHSHSISGQESVVVPQCLKTPAAVRTLINVKQDLIGPPGRQEPRDHVRQQGSVFLASTVHGSSPSLSSMQRNCLRALLNRV